MMIFAVLSPEKFLVGKHCGSAVHAYPKKQLMRVTSDTALFSPSSVSLKKLASYIGLAYCVGIEYGDMQSRMT